ncbi:MAG: AAA family ATPase [Cyanobacteriota bacterium]|jgi:predicted ATP-dependent endonuclease of OLD family
MTITRIELTRFTAFETLDFHPSAGINVLIGANGTGKTHLMKVAYAACDITKTKQSFGEKLVSSFLPSANALGRLVKRLPQSSKAKIRISRAENLHLSIEFSNHIKEPGNPNVKTTGATEWSKQPIESVFIPVKEMLANAPGFRSLYSRRDVHFESIYDDIISRAYLPILRGAAKTDSQKKLLLLLQRSMAGKVAIKGEEFFLKNQRGELEFTLLAEGLRKLGLLWLLIQNGTLTSGSVLFWDEPETNLNPQLFATVVDLLLELHRLGVQIFLTTHDYAVLKEFDLATKDTDQIKYHALYYPEGSDGVVVESHAQPFMLNESPIATAMTSLYDREIKRSLGGAP